jgi:serine/threonine protein kinase
MAPELMEEKEYDTSVDIWSFGCLAVELAENNLTEYLGDIEEHGKMFDKIKKDGPPKLKNKNWSKGF